MHRLVITALVAFGLALPSIAQAGRIKFSSGDGPPQIDIKISKKEKPKNWFGEGSQALSALSELVGILDDDYEKKLKSRLKKKIKAKAKKAKISLGTPTGDLVAKLSRKEMRRFLSEMKTLGAIDAPPSGGVPEPGTGMLMAAGLLGLAGANARIRRKR